MLASAVCTDQSISDSIWLEIAPGLYSVIQMDPSGAESGIRIFSLKLFGWDLFDGCQGNMAGYYTSVKVLHK